VWTQSTKSCTEYLENAKNLTNQLAAAGKLVDDQDLYSFLLGGLLSSYTPFVTSLILHPVKLISHLKIFKLNC
jgi:hypothetical protein